MADFQYLPMGRTESGEYESKVDELLVRTIENSSWIHQPSSIHLAPAFFSRLDTPVEYCFRDDHLSKSSQAEDNPGKSFIGCGEHPSVPGFRISPVIMIGLLQFKRENVEPITPSPWNSELSPFLLSLSWLLRRKPRGTTGTASLFRSLRRYTLIQCPMRWFLWWHLVLFCSCLRRSQSGPRTSWPIGWVRWPHGSRSSWPFPQWPTIGWPVPGGPCGRSLALTQGSTQRPKSIKRWTTESEWDGKVGHYKHWCMWLECSND